MKKIVSIIALGAWSVAALAQSTGGTVKLTAPAGAKFATYGQLHIQVDRDGTVSVPAFMAQRLVAQGFTGAVAPDPRLDLAVSPFVNLYLEACGDHSGRPSVGQQPVSALTVEDLRVKALALFDGGKCVL